MDGLTDEYLAVVPNILNKHITLSSEVYPRCVSRKLKVINSKDKILKKDFINFFCNCVVYSYTFIIDTSTVLFMETEN
jgi:hypothetical protein